MTIFRRARYQIFPRLICAQEDKPAIASELTLPGESGQGKQVGVPEREGVLGAPGVAVGGDVAPFVGGELADEVEHDADNEESDQEEDPVVCGHV